MIQQSGSTKNSKGVSLLEMAIALVVTGIIIGGGLPIAKIFIEQYKHTQDKANISELTELLVGYAMTRGGFPDPDVGNVLPSTNIGMTGKNSYGSDVRYYANALLTESATAQDLTTLCDTAKDILSGAVASTTPAICDDISNAYVDCANSTVAAFVIVSPGSNYAMEHENGDGDDEFENPAKMPGSANDYDDVVASYGLAALVSECQRF